MSSETPITHRGGEIELYETPDGEVRVDVRFDRVTVWLTQCTPDIGKIGKIEEHLDCELPIIKEIMNTNQKNGSKKWRDKRRDIAHGAAPFREKETYEEYRHKIMEGISEIERALNVIASDTSKSQARSQLSRFPKRDQATS